MKIVIDISENDYWLACNHPEALIGVYAQAIKNGTSLPRGHGRLIDADALIRVMDDRAEKSKSDRDLYDASVIATAVDMFAPTIIEADTTRDCKTCGHSKDGKCAYTEECHDCMWESKYIEADNEGEQE